MKLDFQRAVTVPEEVLVREVAGESVLLDLRNEMYFSLDPVGTRIWKVVTGAPSIEDAYAALLEEYDVTPEVLRADLEELLAELLDQGLLEPSEAARDESTGQAGSPETSNPDSQ